MARLVSSKVFLHVFLATLRKKGPWLQLSRVEACDQAAWETGLSGRVCTADGAMEVSVVARPKSSSYGKRCDYRGERLCG